MNALYAQTEMFFQPHTLYVGTEEERGAWSIIPAVTGAHVPNKGAGRSPARARHQPSRAHAFAPLMPATN